MLPRLLLEIRKNWEKGVKSYVTILIFYHKFSRLKSSEVQHSNPRAGVRLANDAGSPLRYDRLPNHAPAK